MSGEKTTQYFEKEGNYATFWTSTSSKYKLDLRFSAFRDKLLFLLFVFLVKRFKVIRPQTQTAFFEKDKVHVIALDKFIFL